MDGYNNQNNICYSRHKCNPMPLMAAQVSMDYGDQGEVAGRSEISSGEQGSKVSPEMVPGMAYVPPQEWGTTYPIDQGLNRGTIFPVLDLPFVAGRCR